MSGLFGDDVSLGSTEPALGAVRVQTSMVGLAIPVTYGRTKIAGNLLWYGGFAAHQVEERSEAGKGGGAPARTTYQYSASMVLSLGHGPMGAVRTAWIGKERFEGVAAGTRGMTASETFTVPGAPHQVTVSQVASWTGTRSVYFNGASWEETGAGGSRDLIEGSDFSVSGGVYTFAAALSGGSVRIDYGYTVATDAASALGRLGLGLAAGLTNQGVWSYLSTQFPSQALAYQGIAYIYGQDYALDNSAEVPNHQFEVDAQFQFSTAIPDANPADVIRDILTNGVYGAEFPASHLDSLTALSVYCAASGIFVSPHYPDQRAARDVIGELLDAIHAMACWTGDKLRFVPLGDRAVSGNGASYTPNTTPAFVVNTDYVVKGSSVNFIDISRPDEAMIPNRFRTEFKNRENQYNSDVVTVDDDASINLTGLRVEAARSMTFIVDGEVAALVTRARAQRSQAARATVTLELPWWFLDLEPGDLLELTDQPTMLSMSIIVQSIEEAEQNRYRVTGLEYPVGRLNAPLVAPQLSSGYRPDYNADPGNVATPMILELPGSSSSSGLELGVAVSGAGAMWGGCEVYVSLDGGSSYKLMGRVEQGARYGALQSVLAAGVAGIVDVTLSGRGGILLPTSSYDADALATLCYVGDAATGEWLSYEGAGLVATNHYQLAGLRRGRYGSADVAHPAGAAFALIDGAVCRSGSLPLAMVGKTIKLKLPSYNVFGGALQSLAVAPMFEYAITGRFVSATGLPLGTNWLHNATFRFDTAGWVTSGNGNSNAVSLVKPSQASDTVGGTLGVSPANAILYSAGTDAAGWPYATEVDSHPVTPGGRLVVMASLLPIRCNAAVGIRYEDAAGAWIASDLLPLENVVADRAVPPRSAVDESNYVTVHHFSFVPPGVVAARAMVLKSGTLYGPDSGVDVLKPFFGPANAEQTVPPLWSVGAQGQVGTAQLQVGAASDVWTPLTDIPGLTVTGATSYGFRELLRFVPTHSGKIVVNVGAMLASQSESGAYIVEAGIIVAGTGAASKIDGTPITVGTVRDVLQTPASTDFATGTLSLCETFSCQAGVEMTVSLYMGRRTRVLIKPSPPPAPPLGTDSATSITVSAVFNKR